MIKKDKDKLQVEMDIKKADEKGEFTQYLNKFCKSKRISY
jgi:hypothetical protein